MAISAREQLARLLGGAGPGGSFAARTAAPADALRLEVAGVGPVVFPLRAPRTKKLIEVARPAKFGRGEETLSDPGVRDTWEITPDRFELGGAGWGPVLDAALGYFRDELGLPAKTRLRAEPYALLVYGKGQFFLPHQDSEKDDAMVGTLVLSLPSAHTGGELVVEHGGRSKVYQASKEALTFVAFYADCRHQVKPVKSGYRVTLTFNLLADAGDEDASGDGGLVADLAGCLTEHFAEPGRPRWGGRELPPPNRLVYLLDHEYTQRGLSWSRLKGADAERAALLRTAATRADCEAVLALAEVKETWDAYPPGGDDPWDRGYGYDRYHDFYDGDDEGDPAPSPGSGAADDYADYELNDLIDDEITLGWWTRPHGKGGEAISSPVSYEERCASTPSKDLKPFRSEYEGYMGNYGNTLDRWYRRSAVLLWPRERAFAARAEAGSEGALVELRDRIAAGELDRARAEAASLAPFWSQAAPQAEALGTALEVAAGLGVPETAAMLLEPFRAEALTPDHAGVLAAAAGAYGRKWTRELVGGWFPAERVWHVSGADRGEWVQGLPQLCDAMRTAGGGYAAQLLADAAWRWLEEELGPWCARARAEERGPRLTELASPLARVWQAAEDERRATIAQALHGYPHTVLECVVPALRAAAKLPAQECRAAGFALLARDCAGRLEAFLATAQRAEGDWAIAWAGCGPVVGGGRAQAGGCGLCDTLAAFLASSSERLLEWPLAKDGRRHVHSAIDRAGLPVNHSTRRQGRPYTLVLTKTDALFTRERQARRTAGKDLAWLKSTWA